ncbi:MAG: serine protease [Phormidesmis sp.]
MIRFKFIVLLITSLMSAFLAQNISSIPIQAVEIDALVNMEQSTSDLDEETFIPPFLEQSDEPLGNARAVVGDDQREPVLSRAFPWSAVGRLEWQFENDIISSCTATLVHSDIILTNSHCLLLPYRDESSGNSSKVFVSAKRYQQLLATQRPVPKLVFKPSLINNSSPDEATVIDVKTGWQIDEYAPDQDWALMKIDAPLGDRYGYLGWRSLDFSNANILEAISEKINLIGYSGDFPTDSLREYGQSAATAGVDRTCSILGVWSEEPLDNIMVHDCDTTSGASGGPILLKFPNNNYYIIGLHARQIPLSEEVSLPNGVSTRVVNGGVQVGEWAQNR